MSTLVRLPRYQQIAEELRLQVRRGELSVGARLPSFPEMKKQGVSQNTVEKAYALLEADGLIERAVGSGVYVKAAVSRSTKRVEAIGFAIDEGNLQHPYWAHLLEGVRAGARRAGCEIVLLEPEARTVRWEKVDGVIGSGLTLPALLRRAPMELPTVALLQRTLHCPTVIYDEPQGVRAAVEHLVALGHRRIAYLFAGYPEWRLDAYRDALRKAGIRPKPQWVRTMHPKKGDRFMPHGRQHMQAWLESDWKKLGCTALLCHNDETALGAEGALREAGLRVPGDLSIIGFDGTEMCEMMTPRLTTIEVPLQEIGERGVELLLRMARSEAVDNDYRETLPVRLKIGASTAPI